jgi:hypothetical protein
MLNKRAKDLERTLDELLAGSPISDPAIMRAPPIQPPLDISSDRITYQFHESREDTHCSGSCGGPEAEL